MLNITDPKKEESKPPIFRLAFRSFFLFGSLFSVLAILLWALFLNSSLNSPLNNLSQTFQPYGSWFWWHGHEMLFGFGCAIIVGFLLTAIQNWSGLPGLSGWPLAALFLLWLAGRLFMFFPVIPHLLIALIDVLFLPAAVVILCKPIITVKLWRNLMFVPLLLLLSWANGYSHYRLLQGDSFSLPETQSTILIITMIILIMGGRVIPFFTANALKLKKPEPVLTLELLSIIPLVLVVLYSLFSRQIEPEFTIGILLLVTALANAVRFGRWNAELTASTPLLWSLHISYLLIILSIGMLSLFHFGLNLSLSSTLHGLTIGGMGLMILAMISRVSLGHTGRPLKVGKLITCSYILLITATITRVIAPLVTHQPTSWYLLSALCWATAFSLFVLVYWPVLTRPRTDGRPG